ncbi:MAG: HGGxSTG domain-containing protein [Gallionella sp.]
MATKQKPATDAAIQQAREELRNAGAAFVVFQFDDCWYELAYPFRKAARICGARKKTGERCRSKALHRGGKCKFHGGLSTGAKTPEGKARAIAAMRAGQARWIAGKTNRMQS